jgi:hypothetical protein
MKKIFRNAFMAIVLIALFSGINGCYPVASVSVGEQYSNPDWAPAYYPGVRYYYLPDIETYYDLSNQDFVYLDDGQWLFSNTLPSMYSSYDLYNGYEIALNVGVYQPWMHHHFYLSNYPRYYYKNIYHNSGNTSVRGFNENVRKPFYSTPEDKVRRTELSRNNKSVITPKVTRQPQQPNYYGKNIGRPVKVQPQMRQARQTTQPRSNQGATQTRGNQEGAQPHGNQGGSEGHERR